MEKLFILTRTSGRPQFFKRCRDSVKKLTGFDVVHIVHSDDPRNESYIDCDILIRGEAHGSYIGSAPYNLYCNRLLENLPGVGWVHFIDDDDEYASSDVFEKLLKDADKNKIICGKVTGWNGQIFPKSPESKKSFQTEIFCTWSNVAVKGDWWANTGGDHYYSRQLTRKHEVEHRNVMIALAQEGKGHGKLVDLGGVEVDKDGAIDEDKQVYIKMNVDSSGHRGARLYKMPYWEARVLGVRVLGALLILAWR